MSLPDPYALDKHRIQAAFDSVAGSFDAVARLEPEVAGRLIEHLHPVRISPQWVLDLGAGTGAAVPRLSQRFPKARLIALDLSRRMLERARANHRSWRSRRSFVRADASAIPLRDNAIDLVFSNLTLPWCTDLSSVFESCARILSDGGLFAFSTLGPDTLKELRDCWAVADAYPHVHRFIDMHDLGDALQGLGFSDVVMDAERLVVQYRDVRILMSDLKSVAGHNLAAGRARGLTSASRLERMTRAYDALRREDLLPATFELVFGHGWKAPRRGVTIPVDTLRRSAVRERPA